MSSRRPSSDDPANTSSALGPPPARTPIPPLVNIAPYIFTPMPEGMFDFLSPTCDEDQEPLRDRVARLRHIIATIEYQRAGVRDNMLYMFDREKERLIQEAEAREAMAPGGREDPSLPYGETDELVAAMEAPAERRVNYALSKEEVVSMATDYGRKRVPERGLTAREKVMEDLFKVMEKGLEELVGYDHHIMGIRRQFAERLEREQALISEAGLRPEERVLGR